MRMLIEKLRAGRDLNSNDINYAVTALFCEEIEDTLKHDFLTQLHRKGETADEIVGFARILRERAIVVPIDQRQLPGPLIDVCGTGGDGIDLFNVSTTIMFILAAGGAVVVKHGSRRLTSTCGSADVLEQLGVNIHLAADEMKE